MSVRKQSAKFVLGRVLFNFMTSTLSLKHIPCYYNKHFKANNVILSWFCFHFRYPNG